MEVGSLNNGGVSGVLMSKPDERGAGNGEHPGASSTSRFVDEIDSSCSTPYVSAPSSPGRAPAMGFFFSAPASPMHYVLSSAAASSSEFVSSSSDISVDFEFSARFNHNSSTAVASMISADELFLNGQIRPMKLSSHLQRPQNLAPLLDLDVEEDEDEEAMEHTQKQENMEEGRVRGRDLRLRNRSLHRRTRSMSPLRNWRDEEGEDDSNKAISLHFDESGPKATEPPSDSTTPSVSASSSRSSSTSSRSSKRWIFLMDFLHRSKSEGRGNNKEKFWSSISFSPSQKEKKTASASRPSSPSRKPKRAPSAAQPATRKTASSSATPANAVGKKRIPPSPHEIHYTANRAQAEELKKKTFLPYRQGLLGCLGFSSKSYGAMNGLARTLNPVSSR